MYDYKPSQVVLTPIPLGDTMGRAEVEYAAALLVRVCHARGDRWQPVTWDMVRAVLRDDVTAKRAPFADLVASRIIYRPDVFALVNRGYASSPSGPADGYVEFTEKGFAALRRWVRT